MTMASRLSPSFADESVPQNMVDIHPVLESLKQSQEFSGLANPQSDLPFQDFAQSLFHWFQTDALSSGATPPWVLEGTFWLTISGILFGVVAFSWFFHKKAFSWFLKKRGKGSEDSQLHKNRLKKAAMKGLFPSKEHWKQFQTYSQSGDLEAAVKELYLATLSLLDESELVPYQKSHATGDFMAAMVPTLSLEFMLGFGKLAYLYESSHFGGCSLMRQDIQRLQSVYHALGQEVAWKKENIPKDVEKS
jgi:hypothetical protein